MVLMPCASSIGALSIVILCSDDLCVTFVGQV
jgi:hypothetical protein